MAENTIDNLSIEVTAISDAATKAFDRLAASANRLRGAASGSASGLQDMAQGAQDAGTATQQAGIQSGKARPNIKGVGKDAKDAGDNAKKGASGLKTFWESLKRIAFYRFVRSVIRSVTDAFKVGAQNLYQWSAATGLSDFKKNMDRIATSALYLKNSLGAMLEPIVRILAPIIDWVVDGIVKVINLINQLFSALSGATTYTVAKKVATTWADTGKTAASSAKKAADDIKRTILGFDEINKLEKQNTNSYGNSSGSNTPSNAVSDMFETKPLDGWAKALSDFVNKIKQWMQPILDWFDNFGEKIKHLWDGFVDGAKDFFSDPLDWLKENVADPVIKGLRTLFGINSPSTEMKIIGTYLIQGLKEGMLKELDGMDGWLKTNIVDVIKKAFRGNSTILYFSPKLDNRPGVIYDTFMREWDNAGSKILYFSPKLDNAATVLYNTFKREWNNAGSKILYFSPKLDNPATVLYNVFKAAWNNAGTKILYFSPKLDNTATVLYNNFKREWDSAGSKILYFSPKLDNTANVLYNNFMWDWNGAGSKTLYFSPKLDNRASVLWNNFVREWNNVKYTLSVDVQLNYIGMSGGGVARSFGGGSSSGAGAGRGRRSIGGVLANGFWQSIPKYAGGTSGAHGTMFIAGEAGPEIVGHIGGRTEVLNKSQIASAMYSAVQAAMAPASANFAAAAYAMNASGAAINLEMFADMVRQGVESAMERERDILRQQLDTLRQINDKDTTVEVSTSSVNRAQSRMNRRYGKTIVPVGT